MTDEPAPGRQPDVHLEMNRAYWTSEAPRYAEIALRNWADQEITWGIWARRNPTTPIAGSRRPLVSSDREGA